MVTDKSLKNGNNCRGRVLFINPASLYLPEIAKMSGFETKIMFDDSNQKLEENILQYKPNYLVENITFQNYLKKMQSLAEIKKLQCGLKIIVTGDPFLTYNTNVTYENPFINYVIIGEAEYTLRDILDGIPDSEIQGICYTDENMQAIKNEPRHFIENLDDLPFPDNNNEGIIEVSRGCEYHCFYCLKSVIYGNKRRCRSTSSVVSEIKKNIEENSKRKFIFKAKNFNSDKEWVKDLCKQIIENNLPIKWSVDIIPQNIDDELAKLMHKAGCEFCNLGIASGALSIIQNTERSISKEEIKNTVKILKKNKIKVNNNFIIGLPWETEETVNETIKYAIDLDLDDVHFNMAIPFPGTKFFVYTMLNKLTGREINFENMSNESLAKTHKLTTKRVAELKNAAERKFYLRPKYVLKNILSLNFKILERIIKIMSKR